LLTLPLYQNLSIQTSYKISKPFPLLSPKSGYILSIGGFPPTKHFKRGDWGGGGNKKYSQKRLQKTFLNWNKCQKPPVLASTIPPMCISGLLVTDYRKNKIRKGGNSLTFNQKMPKSKVKPNHDVFPGKSDPNLSERTLHFYTNSILCFSHKFICAETLVWLLVLQKFVINYFTINLSWSILTR